MTKEAPAVEVEVVEFACPECDHPCVAPIPLDYTEADVIAECENAHRTRIKNPHAVVEASDEDAPDDGTEHVGVADHGTGVDATA